MASGRRSGPTVLPQTSGKIVTAAMDFGTHSSGYAFAFRHEPLKIFTNAWRTENGTALTTAKAPTTVLLSPDRSFHSFGFEAEETYSSLTEDDEHEGWYFFQKFKMELYRNQKLSRETLIYDIENKGMPAMEIFTMVINELKKNLISDVQQNVKDINADDIFWILTVPAIWSDAAKQFMREAANKAGISNDQLRLVLEPEAASLYCQTNCSRKTIQTGMIDLSPLPVGHKYIVADLGGGTADIATHEVLKDENLREIYRATGDELGACKVDLAFTAFLTNLVGEHLEKFKLNFRCDYLDLMREFESKKKSFKVNEKSPMILKFPAGLSECLQNESGLTLGQCIENEKYTELVSVKRDKMRLNPNLVEIFFREPVTQIVEKITEIVKTEHIDSLMLVGGFADSHYVRETITRAFPNIEVKTPEEAGLHVLKGAVLTTIRPQRISERIARYTYGFRVEEAFDDEKHPPNLRDSRASQDYCSDVFHKCIEKGQSLRCGEEFIDEFGGKRETKESKSKTICTELYRSTKSSPTFCTEDDGCERVGQIMLNTPEKGWPDKVEFLAKITVGETEFRMVVVDKTTKQTYETTVDFLQN